MGRIIGIDLGTTNSVVAIMEGSEPKVIVNEEGDRTTPSIVAWDENDNILVGQIAKRQALTNQNTVYSAKRLIGRKLKECEQEAKRLSYTIEAQDNGDACVAIKGKKIAPPEVSAHILRKLKKAAEDHIGEEVTEAVITVPAYFNDAQRQATKDAGRIAGLDVKRIVNEPTAAALAYRLDKKKDEIIAVYDFGGGTFDVSILEVGDSIVQVISTNGDTHLGGDDVDILVMDYLISEFRKDSGVDLSKDKMAIQRVKDSAEKAKIELSSTLETTVNLPFITADASGPKHLNIKLSRAKFENLISPLIERTLDPCKKALSDAGKKASDVKEVVLVGGSTRIPMVYEAVKKFFEREPNKGVNPDEVVALGAAVQAGILSGDVKDMILLDVTPLSLGIETMGGVMTPLIKRNTTIPTRREEVFSTAGDNQTQVEVVVLQGERAQAKDNRLLGRFTVDGLMMAPRGVPKIKVTFDIDANGILSVTARDEASGKDQKIVITASSGITEAEIKKMVSDAEANAEADQNRREEIETRNKAEQFCYTAEKYLQENKDKLPADKVEEVESRTKDLRKALDDNYNSGITEGFAALQKLLHEAASQAYSNTQEQPAPKEEAPKRDDGVIDAEFEDVA
jgi:molecular chaperone DnaK